MSVPTKIGVLELFLDLLRDAVSFGSAIFGSDSDGDNNRSQILQLEANWSYFWSHCVTQSLLGQLILSQFSKQTILDVGANN